MPASALALGCPHPSAERSAGQGCGVVVVQQAVGDEAALRVQGPAGPAQADLAAPTHLPGELQGPELPQGARLLPSRLLPPAFPGQAPPRLLSELAPSLGAATGTERGDRDRESDRDRER